jgi:hypothetical protein
VAEGRKLQTAEHDCRKNGGLNYQKKEASMFAGGQPFCAPASQGKWSAFPALLRDPFSFPAASRFARIALDGSGRN